MPLSKESKEILRAQVILLKEKRSKAHKENEDLKQSVVSVSSRKDKAEKEFRDTDRQIRAIENDLKI